MNSWRFPIQFSFLCSGGYIAVLVLQQQLQSPSSLDGVWLLFEWLVGPFVGLLIAWLGWRDLERPALGHVWQRIATGLFGALCGAFGTMPFWDSLVGFPGTGIGIGLTVLLGCAFGWWAMLTTGAAVILMTFAAAASLPAFSSNANAVSLLMVFTGSLTVFVPFGRAVQWVFNHANREVLVRRMDRALAALTGQLELAEASSVIEPQLPVITTRTTGKTVEIGGSPKTEPIASDAVLEPDVVAPPEANSAEIKERVILELELNAEQVAYLDAAVRLPNNKSLARYFKVNPAKVKRMLEPVYDLTGISEARLPPVRARKQLIDWLKRHGFGAPLGSNGSGRMAQRT